jgi:hypothetical protein
LLVWDAGLAAQEPAAIERDFTYPLYYICSSQLDSPTVVMFHPYHPSFARKPRDCRDPFLNPAASGDINGTREAMYVSGPMKIEDYMR